jgi:hypothetical protein
MSATPRRTPRLSPTIARADVSDGTLKKMICQLIDQNAALLSAGEKMHAALLQYHVRSHVIHEWEAVTHAIKSSKSCT